MQFIPPFEGLGLVHDRDLDLWPPPQRAEHDDQIVQFAQLPFTVNSLKLNTLTIHSVLYVI